MTDDDLSLIRTKPQQAPEMHQDPCIFEMRAVFVLVMTYYCMRRRHPWRKNMHNPYESYALAYYYFMHAVPVDWE